MVPLLDSTRDCVAIVKRLENRVADGALVVSQDDKPLTDPEPIQVALLKAMEKALTELARAALFVG